MCSRQRRNTSCGLPIRARPRAQNLCFAKILYSRPHNHLQLPLPPRPHKTSTKARRSPHLWRHAISARPRQAIMHTIVHHISSTLTNLYPSTVISSKPASPLPNSVFKDTPKTVISENPRESASKFLNKRTQFQGLEFAANIRYDNNLRQNLGRTCTRQRTQFANPRPSNPYHSVRSSLRLQALARKRRTQHSHTACAPPLLLLRDVFLQNKPSFLPVVTAIRYYFERVYKTMRPIRYRKNKPDLPARRP